MSLAERAQRAETQKEGIAEFDSLDALRSYVQRYLSAAEMAHLIERSPYQARSEIRLACERALKENPWIVPQAQEKEEVIARYLDSVFGLGPLETLLADEQVTEIMVNGCQSLYYESEGTLRKSSSVFSSDDQVYALIDRIISPLGRRVDESSPMVNARLPQGHRVNAIIPPLALDGPIVTIRKFRSKVYSLDELRAFGSFDKHMQQLMEWSVLLRKNVAVSGGTGSGKTTLLNALSSVIPHQERIITIEDSAELRFLEHPHVVRLEARPRNAEGVGEVAIKDLVINALRMRPDRIVVGECRGAEALDMLQAMNTGHDGSLTTLHANSPTEAISRLTTMVRYGAELPVEVIENQIASALDLVIQTARNSQGKRFVCEVVGLSYSREERACVIQPYFVWDHRSNSGSWTTYPAWIDDLPFAGIATKQEVEEWKQSVSYQALAS